MPPKFRAIKHKKPKFQGNQHTKSGGKPATCASASSSKESHAANDDSQPIDLSMKTASQKKINPEPSVKASTAPFTGFRLIDVDILKTVFECVLCKYCKAGSLELQENADMKMGLSNHWTLTCSFCGHMKEFYTSAKCEQEGKRDAFEINRRIVLGMTSIGGSYTDLLHLTTTLNIPSPMNPKTYEANLYILKEAAEETATSSMKTAAADEHKEASVPENDICDTKVMLDGTWRKRGHSSLQGAVTCISATTGKVLDYETLNKVCKGCSNWASKDKETEEYQNFLLNHKCAINYTGSAPSIEPEGAVRMFRRSEQVCKLRYTSYIGDGDSKSYLAVKESNPYGKKTVKKLECVGHVQKRMGTNLRNLKKSLSGQKLSDGKTIGGRGRLTDQKIDKLQVYYGLAIRRHKGDMQSMRKEVLAGLYHSCSTDDKPQHQYCPSGETSWCKWQQTRASVAPPPKRHRGRPSKKKEQEPAVQFQHKDPLPAAIMEKLLPVYEKLSAAELLSKCVDGYTQNCCESINNLIWIRCPKRTHSGRNHLDFAVADAVCIWNDGYTTHNDILHRVGVQPGYHTILGHSNADAKRVHHSTRKASKVQQKVRQSKRMARKDAEETLIQQEGVTYSAGAF